MDTLKNMEAETKLFFAWVQTCRDNKLNIGPVNEQLISLYEDVKTRPLSLQTKQYILSRNQ